MSEEVLTTERDGAVLVVTLNRPLSKNALNPALTKALGAALGAASDDGSVRAVVLTGSGGSFCSGADLKESLQEMSSGAGLEPRRDPQSRSLEGAIEQYHTMIRAIVGAPKPVIAAVDGPAVGFGCDLALACDLRVGSTEAYFQEKFVKIGLMPDGGGTFWLPRLVGLARAMEIILTGDPVRADRALELGLLNGVVPPGKLREEAMGLAQRLAKGPPLAYAEIKRAVRQSLGGTIDTALAAEKAGQLRCLASADCMEGVMAWMQKREPAFEGK